MAVAVVTECPCEGQAVAEDETPAWRNHGRYVRCVAKYAKRLRRSDCLTREAQRLLKRCAARSTCGKAGRVLCCTSKADMCSDPTPDGLADGVCDNDPEVACDTNADCTTTKARITRSEDACLARGGEVDGEGSVCTACLPPTP